MIVSRAMPPAMAFRKDQSAGYLINHLARLFARRFSARINTAGTDHRHLPGLAGAMGGGRLDGKDLVERLDIEQATMANTLARMERDGLIVRNSDRNGRPGSARMGGIAA